MTGGSLRYGVVMDPTDEIDQYDQVKLAISSSSVNGIKKVPASYEVTVPGNLFNEDKFTSLGDNARFSEYGYLIFIIDADPSAAGSISIDVEANITFKTPSLESPAIGHNGDLPCALYTIDGKAGLYLGDLLTRDTYTIDDVMQVWSKLPNQACIFKVVKTVGAFSQGVGAGNSDTVTFDLVAFDPSVSNQQFFMPVLINYEDGNFGYQILTNASDHGAKGWAHQIAIASGTTYKVIATDVDSLNQKTNGTPVSRSAKVWTKNGLVQTENEEVSPVGPTPPNRIEVDVNQEQLDALEEHVNQHVDDAHAETRESLESPIGDLNGGLAELNTLIVEQGTETRLLVREKHSVTIAELSASTASLLAEVGATISAVHSNGSTAATISSDIETISEAQTSAEVNAVSRHNSVMSSTTSNHTAINAVLNTVSETSTAVNEMSDATTSSHQQILNAIANLPQFDNYDLVHNELSAVNSNYGVSTENLVVALNNLMALFGLTAVSDVTYDLKITVEDLVSYLYAGRLFAINGSSDVPMDTPADYHWPSFGTITGPDILGLYFRTQYASSIEGYDVYQYFRIAAFDGPDLCCNKHVAGQPALPRP